MEVLFPRAVTGRSLCCRRSAILNLCRTGGLAIVACLLFQSVAWSAPFDFTGPVTAVSATPGQTRVTLDALDPAVGGLVSANIPLVGGTPSPVNSSAIGGFASWSSGPRVYYYVYDPFRRLWVGTNANTGTTFDLRNTNGVIAWTSGSTAHYAAYDWTRSRWVKDSAPIGSVATSLEVADGIAAGSTGAGVFYAAFDPRSGTWIKNSAATGIPGEFRSAQGVVAWTAGNWVYGRAYDPRSSSWKDHNLNVGATPFDLRNSGGVLAWTHAPLVGYAAFDGPRGVWSNQVVNAGFATDLVVSNSTVYWNTTQAFRRGYRPRQGGWTENVSGVDAAFVVSTNFVAAPVTISFIDLSFGGTTWLWNFNGGAGDVTRRSPLVRFSGLGQFLVTENVSGDGGLSSTNLLIVTDISPPTGTMMINGGDDLTTNVNVTLQLSATDNSGTVASMRFANDTTNTWSEWEAFAPTKSWTLSPNGGLKTVFAQFRDSGGNVSAIVSDTITLDSTPPPILSWVSTNVVENAGNIVVQAVLNHPVNRTVSARYVTSDGTATDGEDYTRQQGLIVFPPNSVVTTITIPLLVDASVELNETIFLNLSNPTNAALGEVGTVTILDDDPASVAFANVNFNAAEDIGTASVVVRLNAASGQTVSVRVFAKPGTATDGQDFVSTNGLLVFLPGQTNRAFSVPILDDVVDEFTETVALTLTNLTNAVIGIPAQSVLSILDNDQPFIGFSADAVSGFEDEFSIPLRVQLSKPYSQQVSANYTIFGGTATPGQDYTVLGTVIIPAGSTNATITIFPINDSNRESDETARLRLTDIAGATPGRTETTVTILDDDGAPRFMSSSVTAGELRAGIRGRAAQAFDVEATTNWQSWGFFQRLTNSAAGVCELAVPITVSPRSFRLVSP